MNIQEQLGQTVARKTKQYTAVAKHLATNTKVITTAALIGTAFLAPEALANDGSSELGGLNFEELAEQGIEYMKKGAKAGFAALGVGLTVVGGLKGYTMLKGGIKRA